MPNNFPVSLDDLKQWYYGVTNPGTWQRAGDQLSVMRNNISNVANKVVPAGGNPIPGPPMSFSDLWKRLQSVTNTPGKGVTQPDNRSGY